MATANPNTDFHETEEELQLEAELKVMTDKKKAVFEKTREADEELWKIREDEERKKAKMLHIRTEREENQQLRKYVSSLEAERRGAQAEIEQLKQQVVALTKVANENRTLGQSEMEELESLRQKYSEQTQRLEKLKENLRSTTKYSKAQRKEKLEKQEETDKLLNHIKSLEDAMQMHDQNNVQTTASGSDMELQAKLEILSIENVQLKAENVRVKNMAERQTKSTLELKGNLQSISREQRTQKIQNVQLKAENVRVKNMAERQTKSTLELKGNLQSISREQRTTIKCLKDVNSAAPQITVETQLRQLSEAEDEETKESEERKQLKQALTTLLHHQQQRLANEKYIRSEYLTICSCCWLK